MVAIERYPEAQPNAATPPALAIDGVSHSYGPRRALADVSLSIPPATFVVLLGLNGAGKSTLFSLGYTDSSRRSADKFVFLATTSPGRPAPPCVCLAWCFSCARSTSIYR